MSQQDGTSSFFYSAILCAHESGKSLSVPANAWESINPKRQMCLCVLASACLCLWVNMCMHMKFWYLSDMQIPNQSTIMTKSPHVVPGSHPGLMDKYQYAHCLHCISPTNIHIYSHSFYTCVFFSFFWGGVGGELSLINCIPLPPLLNRWGKYPLYNKSLMAYD